MKRKVILGIAGCRDDSRFNRRRERSTDRSRNADTNDLRRRRESSRKVAAGIDYNRPQNCHARGEFAGWQLVGNRHFPA